MLTLRLWKYYDLFMDFIFCHVMNVAARFGARFCLCRAGHFPKFTLNFTLYGTLFIMPNGKFAPGKFWKGKRNGVVEPSCQPDEACCSLCVLCVVRILGLSTE